MLKKLLKNFNLSKKMAFFYSHLLISIFLAIFSVILVFFIWYQYPISTAVGVNEIFLMMLLIDVSIGPILALLVYKEGKKSLKFDLAFIIILQASAYVYGMYSVFVARPVFIAYTLDRFEVVSAADIEKNMLKEAKPKFQSLPLLKPKYINAQNPKDLEAKNDILFAESMGMSIARMPSTYNDFSTAYSDMTERAKELDELSKYNNNSESILSKYPNANQYLPLKARDQDMTVLVNTKDPTKPEVVAIVNLRPWN